MTDKGKYSLLNELEHILLRPGMYIGTIKFENQIQYVLNEDSNKFEKCSLNINPGFQKLFDEVISNSVDESKREDTLLDTIKVTIDRKKNNITVWDNGGIPVTKFEDTDKYIPEVIFSNLRAGSNFNDDTDQREGVGTNGLGAKLTSIYSLKFTVKTADNKHKFTQVYKNNMSKISEPKIEDSDKHFTEISYDTDFKKFGMSEIDDDNYKLMVKRVYDVAGCNPNLKVYLNGKQIKMKSFKDFCNMFIENNNLIYEETKDKKWCVGVAESTNDFQNVSFINGVNTWSNDSTNVTFIMNQILPDLRAKLEKKYKTNILPGQIKQHMIVFINGTCKNPMFSSQTKERLISDTKDFINPIDLSQSFLKKIYNSEIINLVADWLDQKKSADERKAERELNKSLSKVKVEKLIDAKGKDRSKCEFFIAEGDSPLASFRKFRNPMIHGALPIRGKIKNVYDLTPTQALQNEEVKAIFASLGLQIGVCPFKFDSKGNIIENSMRYDTINYLTDADQDGNCIAALLLNIFYKFFPELIACHKISRILTPLLTIQKGKEYKEFYYQKDYDEWCKKNDSTKYNVKYFKGLSSLDNEMCKKMINTPVRFYYTEDDLAKDKFKIWFGDDSDLRKNEII